MYSSKPDDDNLPEVVPFSAPEVALSNAPEVAPSNAPETLSPQDAEYAKNLEESQAKYPVLADPTPLYYPVEKSDVVAGTVISPLSPDEAKALGGLDAALTNDGASTALSPSSPSLGTNEDAEAQGGNEDEAKKERTYCGLSKRNLIIIIVVAIVLVAALAGGLGGGLASKRNTTGNADGGSPEAVSGSTTASTVSNTIGSTIASASSTAFSSSSASPTSTTPVPSPTATSVDGDEDFSFDGWAAINYKGNETPTYKRVGFIDLPFNVSSYVWNRGGTLCCLTFCQGTTRSTGYWCDTRERPAAAEYFDRIYVWCDQDTTGRGSMCSQS